MNFSCKPITVTLTITLTTLTLTGLTMKANAFAPIAESAEVLKSTDYQAGVLPTIFTNAGGGPQINVFFDMPISDSSSARLLLGTGAIDFVAGASYKYIPFPDVGTQPAMGVRGAAYSARDEGTNYFSLEIAPLISKKVENGNGPFFPYVAVPIRYVIEKRNYVATQMALGADWHPNEIQDYFFNAELGINLNDSYSYVAIAVTLPFDKKKGIKTRD